MQAPEAVPRTAPFQLTTPHALISSDLRCLYIINKYVIIKTIFFTMAQQPPVVQGLLVIEASRSHSIKHNTIGRTSLDE
jgi:hypothetical protein